MAPKHRNDKKKKGGMVKLKMKIVVEKLLLLGGRKSSSNNYDDEVPEDVKEGHFAVIAEDGGMSPKRFVVPLRCLTHPTFLKLLEEAAEEYGFEQEGAITIPCSPTQLQTILADAHQQCHHLHTHSYSYSHSQTWT